MSRALSERERGRVLGTAWNTPEKSLFAGNSEWGTETGSPVRAPQDIVEQRSGCPAPFARSIFHHPW